MLEHTLLELFMCLNFALEYYKLTEVQGTYLFLFVPVPW